jgi:hypothetical protein
MITFTTLHEDGTATVSAWAVPDNKADEQLQSLIEFFGPPIEAFADNKAVENISGNQDQLLWMGPSELGES